MFITLISKEIWESKGQRIMFFSPDKVKVKCMEQKSLVVFLRIQKVNHELALNNVSLNFISFIVLRKQLAVFNAGSLFKFVRIRSLEKGLFFILFSLSDALTRLTVVFACLA